MLENIAFFIMKRIRRLEIRYYRKKMNLGKKVRLRRPLVIQHPENIFMEDYVSVNINCTFLAHGKISIGTNTIIGPNVSIITVNHDYREKGRDIHAARIKLPVTIGENVWIGAGAVILPGITIGSEAVIAAGSVVTKDVGKGDIVGGNPVRFIKKR